MLARLQCDSDALCRDCWNNGGWIRGGVNCADGQSGRGLKTNSALVQNTARPAAEIAKSVAAE